MTEPDRERAWHEVAVLDEAHARGEIDDAAWHAARAELVVPARLAAGTPQAGSGHPGTPEAWEWSRGILAEALDRDASFLDVGCSNGLLMESMRRWGAQRGFVVEPHGLDIAPELAALARRRLPHWAGRIHVGNALGWTPPRRYDVVRASLGCVPPARRRALVSWLLDEVVEPGGRLVLGEAHEAPAERELETQLASWGFRVAGRAERAHSADPRLAHRSAWIDAPARRADGMRFRALRRSDFPLLRRWLAAPHVHAWWRETFDDAGIEAKYGPHVDGAGRTRHSIVEEHGRAVAFVQWYRWSDYAEHAAAIGAGADEAGVDLFVGEQDALGRGLGTRMLRAIADDVIFAFPDIVGCASDPDLANARSRAAFRGAGFHEASLLGEPPDRVLVRRRRDGSCAG